MLSTQNIEIKKSFAWRIFQQDVFLEHLFFVVFFYLSVWLYRERVYHGDNAFYCFNILNTQNFCIINERYLAAITQWLPVCLAKINFSIKWVALAYSVNVTLSYYMLYAIIRFWLKDKQNAMLFIALMCFPVYDSFYFMVLEFSWGIGYAVLWYALLKHWLRLQHSFFSLSGLILSVLTFISIYIHPINPIVIGMVLGFEIAQNFSFKQLYRFLPIIALLLIAILYQSFYLNQNSHDIGLKKVSSNFLLKNINEGFQYTAFWHYFHKKYIWRFAIPLWGGLMLFHWLKEKKYVMIFFNVGLLFISFTLVFMVNHLSFNYTYSEGYLIVFFLFLLLPAVPFIIDYYEKWLSIKMLWWGFVLFSCFNIGNNQDFKLSVADRTAIFDKIRQTTPICKIVVVDKNRFFSRKHKGIEWALPFETLLQSAETGSLITIYSPSWEGEPIPEFIFQQKHLFVGAPWEMPFPQKDLSQQYFKLCDTPYQKLSVSDLPKPFVY